MVENGPEAVEGIVNFGVHVPAAVLDGDKTDPGLAQSTGQKHLTAQVVGGEEIAGPVVSVELAGGRIFVLDVEGFTGLAGEQLKGLALEAVKALHDTRQIDVATKGVEDPQHGATVVEAVERKLEVHVLGGIAAGVEGSVGGAEPGGTMAKKTQHETPRTNGPHVLTTNTLVFR
jgi:hypothetical protein